MSVRESLAFPLGEKFSTTGERMGQEEDCQNAKLRATCGNLGCRCKALVTTRLRKRRSQHCQVAKVHGAWA